MRGCSLCVIQPSGCKDVVQVCVGTVPFSRHSLIHRSVVPAALLRLGYAGHSHIGMCLLLHRVGQVGVVCVRE